jgi:hypothetical protein
MVKVTSSKKIFKNREEVVDFLENYFSNVTYKTIIDKKLNVLHEYYSNDKKIAYTEYQFNPKDEERMKFKHKLVLVDNN